MKALAGLLVIAIYLAIVGGFVAFVWWIIFSVFKAVVL